MAKIISPVWSIIRGSIAGTTYTANQYAPIVGRQRVSPVNPKTSAQTIIRSAFSSAANLWKDLSDADRTAWDDYASTCIFSGPTGTKTISGRLMFIRNIGTANYLIQLGHIAGPIDTTPPTIPGFLDVGTISVGTFPTAASTGISVQIDYAGGYNITPYVFRSVAQNPSRYRWKSPWVHGSLISTDIVGASSTLMNFSGLTVDLAYFTKIRAITTAAPFRLSSDTILRHIAVTNP